MEQIILADKRFRGDSIPLPDSINLLVLQGSKGMLACGYVSLDAAEKFGHALAVVSGVATFDDMLKAKVAKVSAAAAALGIQPGMSGQEALLKLA